MASPLVQKAFSGAHTAGIYSDMTVDGLEIGDLVVIVDKAKNLPNRKTMGKQDPYCACRLGKEAKKTTTDKRGGQTPRWDQELRFVVHESPDYDRLKVTVFNDDKKTDLIGETWVNLEEVVVPGGGQSDMWHHLQFKGKYAGEIRIEMTYYDTRPKDESIVEKRRENSRSSMAKGSREMLAGPRQPKTPKRRPLPGEPTSASRSPVQVLQSENHPASASQTPPRPHPESWGADPRVPVPRHNSHPIDDFQPSEGYRPHYESHEMDDPYSSHLDEPVHYDHMNLSTSDMHDGHHNSVYQLPSTQVPYSQFDDFQDLPDGPPPPPPAHNSRHASPALPVAPPLTHHAASDPYHVSNSVQEHAARSLQLAQNSNFYAGSHHHSSPHLDHDGDHRRNHSDHSLPRRLSGRPSAVAEHQPPFVAEHFEEHAPEPRRASMNDVYEDHNAYSKQPESYSSQSEMPPSLMPGYNPVTLYQEHGQPDAYAPPSHQSESHTPRQSLPPTPLPSHQPNTPHGSMYAQYGSSPTKPSPLHDGQRAHQSTYSIVKPRTRSPNPRTPSRKSVSPQPHSQPKDERRLSGIPFSPDSYDALNPNAGSSPPVHPEYHTPDEARDAARRGRRIDPDEPIRGMDGRIIDPSDHIPVDNWAPEPERKSPVKRTSQVDGWTRPSPTGAQPLPTSARRSYRESGMRPLSTHAPIHAHSDSQPTTPTYGRNKLQKKSRPQGSSPTQAIGSSPFAPGSADISPRSPADQPLRERQNFYGNSPAYRSHGPSSRASPAGPPPVPAKIPIDHYEQDRLSEELRSIDIGSGRRRFR